MKKYSYLILTLLTLLAFGCSNETTTNEKEATKGKRVILIGIDGFSTDGLQIANTPNLDALISEGAISLKTRGVMPTVSAPNWGSMLLGAGPEQHGITNNGWTTDNHIVEPQVADEAGYFPSIFKVLKDNNPAIKMAVFYQWSGLGDLFNHKYLTEVTRDEDYMVSMNKAANYLVKEKGDFCFLYIGHPDHIGHDKGHYTVPYYESIEEVDSVLGIFFNKLKEAQLYKNSHFIVISDHGGFGRGHGGLTEGEIEVPWIIKGPDVIKNKVISQANNNFNTASTIAYIFDVNQPNEWIGKPVRGAFLNTTASRANKTIYVAKPSINVKSGLYTNPIKVELNVTDGESEIFYTLDGSLPTTKSEIYSEPLTINSSTNFVARAHNFNNWSKEVVADIKFISGIKNITLAIPPSSKYSGMGPLSLFDNSLGDENYSSGKWLGFEKNDLIAKVNLGDKKMVNKITVRCMVSEGTWIFKPKGFAINNKNVEAVLNKKGAIHEYTIDVNSEMRSFNLTVLNQGLCPPGHAGEGNPAWLFVDEIMIE